MKLKTKVLALLTLSAALIFGGSLTAGAAYQYEPENCKHLTYQKWDKERNTEHYNNTFRNVGIVNPDANMCSLCGEECSHPAEYREYRSGEFRSDYYYEDGKHYLMYHCTYCNSGVNKVGDQSCYSNNGTPLFDKTKGELCIGEIKQNDQQPNRAVTHTARCSKCEYEKTENCTFTTSYEPYYYPNSRIADSHDIIYKCTKCGGGQSFVDHNEGHSFNEKNECTLCHYKIITPGSVKLKSAKQSKAAKKYTVKGGGYYVSSYSGTSKIPSSVRYVKKYTLKRKCYPIKITLKSKTKNADAYLVSTSKKFSGNSVQRFAGKSKSFTYNYAVSNSKKPKKVTLYIKAVSETGNFSKVVKKTVKLKN